MSKSEPEAIKLTFAAPSIATPQYNLNVDTGSSMAEAFVVDGNYKVVARGTGSFDAKLDAGRYQLKVRVGTETEDQWLDLTEDKSVAIQPEQTLNSAAPIDPTIWPDSLLQEIQEFVGDANLMIVVRDAEKSIPKDSQVTVFDSQGTKKRFQKLTLGDGSIVALKFPRLKQGGYRLQVGSKVGSPVEMSVWVTAQFQTQVFFERCPIYRLRTSDPSLGVTKRTVHERAPHYRTAAITILPMWTDIGTQRDCWRQTELAKASLAELRTVAPVEETIMAVHQKFQCPMLGLLGAHQLYRLVHNQIAFDSQGYETNHLMQTVIDNLSQMLEGCPDILALRFAFGNETDFVLRMPPMLWQSWNLIAPNASVKNIPRDSLTSQIGLALTNIRPWLVWKTELLPQVAEEGAEPNFVEKRILQTKKTHQKIGALADQYSLPRSTVRQILKK